MHAHAHTKTRKEAWEREAQKTRQANTRQTTPNKRGIHTQMGCDKTTSVPKRARETEKERQDCKRFSTTNTRKVCTRHKLTKKQVHMQEGRDLMLD